jgi:hypothetical protein
MGETSVGGSEVIKNLKDDGIAFDVGRISSTRLKNVAKAYAWWIAKDSLMLGILKVIIRVNILSGLTKSFTACRFHVTSAANTGVPQRNDGSDFY